MLQAGHHSTGKPGEIAPATLPDTPQVSLQALPCELPAPGPQLSLPTMLQNFPISESKLIDIAKKLYAEDTGTKSPDALAPDFRFEFPIVSLGKKVSPGSNPSELSLLSHQAQQCPPNNIRCWPAGISESSGHLQS